MAVNGTSGDMGIKRDAAKRSGVSAGMLLAGAVAVLALPSAVLAFSGGFDAKASDSRAGKSTPSVSEPRLARSISVGSLAKGQLYRFTPAGTSMRPGRLVTVAVRVDPDTARAITVRSRVMTAQNTVAPPTPTTIPLRIAPNAYNLGVSRGYHGFVVPREALRADIQDMGGFKLGSTPKAGDPRFSPHISLDEATGRAPRTFAGEGKDTVDVGGSYRLSRNLNVTAGVRYSTPERDRLAPLTDGKQDGQAVYVGTQFRF
jgi:hypothetical protein